MENHLHSTSAHCSHEAEVTHFTHDSQAHLMSHEHHEHSMSRHQHEGHYSGMAHIEHHKMMIQNFKKRFWGSLVLEYCISLWYSVFMSLTQVS